MREPRAGYPMSARSSWENIEKSQAGPTDANDQPKAKIALVDHCLNESHKSDYDATIAIFSCSARSTVRRVPKYISSSSPQKEILFSALRKTSIPNYIPIQMFVLITIMCIYLHF